MDTDLLNLIETRNWMVEPLGDGRWEITGPDTHAIAPTLRDALHAARDEQDRRAAARA